MSFEACAPVSSGSEFLKGSLAYLDCSGRSIGSAGYIALSQPTSIPSQLVLTAVTLFIAWHGIRMMFGRMPDMSDAVLAAAKIGLVVMLVSSWPAVRTLFASPIFNGPAEMSVQARLEGPMTLEDRLQQVDNGIVTLTRWGSGKLDIRAGQTADGQPAATEFSGIALTDNLALGMGRLCFLIGALISIGLLKLVAGIMISALPIFAGLLLFEGARGLFWGWLRMLFALFVASFAIPLILTAEVSLIGPWLARAIEDRSSYFATPSAPTELLAISGSFLPILLGSIVLIVRICFTLDFAGLVHRAEQVRRFNPSIERLPEVPASTMILNKTPSGLSRAESLAVSIGRLDHAVGRDRMLVEASSHRVVGNGVVQSEFGRQPTTSGGRRAKQRITLSHTKRNRQ
jgi:type IV secretion system protein VirB6